MFSVLRSAYAQMHKCKRHNITDLPCARFICSACTQKFELQHHPIVISIVLHNKHDNAAEKKDTKRWRKFINALRTRKASKIQIQIQNNTQIYFIVVPSIVCCGWLALVLVSSFFFPIFNVWCTKRKKKRKKTFLKRCAFLDLLRICASPFFVWFRHKWWWRDCLSSSSSFFFSSSSLSVSPPLPLSLFFECTMNSISENDEIKRTLKNHH